MATMMKAAVFVDKNRIELVDKPIPDVGPNDALMRITRFDDVEIFELQDLVALLADVAPLAAAREAEKAWHRHGDRVWLMRTLELYGVAGRPPIASHKFTYVMQIAD